ncbi:MAG: hypothetical protein PUG67_08540 [Peptoniphilaceae bacterium]|nr:hypothetical protein [Peptoniphilaceae bacterium]MDY6019349.1 hypothetical protein [Anaerococcus sp.]
MKKTNSIAYLKAIGYFVMALSFFFIRTRSSQMLVCFIGALGVVIGSLCDNRDPLKAKALYLSLEIIVAIGFLLAFLKS